MMFSFSAIFICYTGNIFIFHKRSRNFFGNVLQFVSRRYRSDLDDIFQNPAVPQLTRVTQPQHGIAAASAPSDDAVVDKQPQASRSGDNLLSSDSNASATDLGPPPSYEQATQNKS